MACSAAKLTEIAGIAGLNVNWFWQATVDYNLAITNPTIPRDDAIIRPYGLLNLRLSYRLEDSGWEFAVWGKNVLNKDYYTRLQDLTAIGYFLAFAGAPATYGLDLRKRF